MPYLGRAPVGVAGNVIEGDLKVTGQLTAEDTLFKQILDGTDGSSSNAGDNLLIEDGGTDGSGTNAGDDICIEKQTADIQDNDITLAKMAGGTDGNIISYDASGDPVAIATGNDGQVLTSTGAGSPPAFEDAAGGGSMTLIGTVVASDDSTITITGINATYSRYVIDFTDIVPETDAQDFYVRLGTSGGILSAGGYGYSSFFSSMAGGAAVETSESSGNDGLTVSNNRTEIHITPPGTSGVGATAPGGVNCTMNLLMPHTQVTAANWHWWGMLRNGTGNRHYSFRGFGIRADSSEDITQIQAFFQSGNVESGRMTVWGVAHA